MLVLVDEPALDELGGERRPANLDLAVELLLELRQLLADVAANEPRAVLDGLELVREDHLRRRVPDPGELAHRLRRGRVGFAGRPVGGHHLPESPAVHGDSHLALAIVEPRVQLVVDVPPVERVVRRLDVAVE